MDSKTIRSQFLTYFQQLDHHFVRSMPVIAYNDPSLLFTNAGMNQFKNIFLELETPEYSRAVNSQKCMRVSGKHNDLEEVGQDKTHHTFFEMLGNWSFGDYYKAEAIEWAWKLLTKEWKLDPKRLYATVYKDDEEAEKLWQKISELPSDRILRFGEKDNFWEMGEVGPCGPCSEIHYDLGESFEIPGIKSGVNADGCQRYIEIWNLVFIQYDRQTQGELLPLPKKHIDTGMGFERIVSILQNKPSNYDTDLFMGIIHNIETLSNHSYEKEDQVPFRVIADHIRAVCFCLADGALPSNEGRGYVIRRLLRRAVRYATKLQLHEPFLHKLVDTVLQIMGEAYPELHVHQAMIKQSIQQEEEGFLKTLDQGIQRFESIALSVQEKGESAFPGDEAFKLYDTFGFPFDLTQLMAKERNLSLDDTVFNTKMEEQRQRAREAGDFTYAQETLHWHVCSDTAKPDHASNFIGYSELACDTQVYKCALTEGGTRIITQQTPFYAESGGQIADKGSIIHQDRTYSIHEVRTIGGEIVHYLTDCIPIESFIQHPMVHLKVDATHRMQVQRNHTATHLLHAALRKVLGDHVTQQGSLVEPSRLRFDFNHFHKMTPQELTQVEQIVNQEILANKKVLWYNTSLTEAKDQGITALFGEKYGEEVRVVEIEDYSKELCGGTHVPQTGNIGLFKILLESSSSAGIRRLEAITGTSALEWVEQKDALIRSLMQTLNVTQESEMLPRVESVLQQKKEVEKELEKSKLEQALAGSDDLLKNGIPIHDFTLVTGTVQANSVDELRKIGDDIRNKLGSGIGILYAHVQSKHTLLCTITDDLIKQKNYHAGSLIKQIAQLCGGSGGGKPHQAIAGIKEPEKVHQAFSKVQEFL